MALLKLIRDSAAADGVIGRAANRFRGKSHREAASGDCCIAEVRTSILRLRTGQRGREACVAIRFRATGFHRTLSCLRSDGTAGFLYLTGTSAICLRSEGRCCMKAAKPFISIYLFDLAYRQVLLY